MNHLIFRSGNETSKSTSFRKDRSTRKNHPGIKSDSKSDILISEIYQLLDHYREIERGSITAASMNEPSQIMSRIKRLSNLIDWNKYPDQKLRIVERLISDAQERIQKDNGAVSSFSSKIVLLKEIPSEGEKI